MFGPVRDRPREAGPVLEIARVLDHAQQPRLLVGLDADQRKMRLDDEYEVLDCVHAGFFVPGR